MKELIWQRNLWRSDHLLRMRRNGNPATSKVHLLAITHQWHDKLTP